MHPVICICGAGSMGSGIAQVSAQSGFHTILYDLNAGMLELAKTNIRKNLQAQAEKNKISFTAIQETMDRLQFTNHINDCIATIIIEAILETLAAKTSLFSKLAQINAPESIFATNTSSLSITALAENIPFPERVIGMHFFNPAPLMKLVEIVNTPYTAEKTMAVIEDLAKQFGKTPIPCKDAPGFIVNHVARPFYLESLRLVEQGICDYETIDTLLENTGFKMGPFKLMDFIGNDINYAVSCSIYESMGRPLRLKPSPIQEQKVGDKALGKKTGRGYYDYR